MFVQYGFAPTTNSKIAVDSYGVASAATPTADPSTSGGTGEGRGGNHTTITGDEAAKVTAAVKAKDCAVSVTSVRKDPDASYDVFGTKSGAQVRYEVSADLKTITQDTDRPERGCNPAPAPSSSTN
jgi:hypothetical protein